ncbi:hypothetical protein MMAN_56370 [Mycobacterium mantenii]|uniref:Uncharacterized protein n=1 Tax=Mycobacterium mantenii TaxID=560555 RepID=A0ABN6AHZ2_MYCNT|nr:hypothetical protein MMAN_56370 [Mycobacterium mantenii]
MHVDDDPVARRLVDVGQLDRVRTIEPGHLYRAHATSVVTVIGAAVGECARTALDQPTAGSETARDPHHGPAGEFAGAHLVDHADDVFHVDVADQ